tara:strand:+ start:945 stop:1133 length:189 start_codon:yes stop_codon:yes gene_type:complete
MTTEEKIIEKRGQVAILTQEIDELSYQLDQEERAERKERREDRERSQWLNEFTSRQAAYHRR